MFAALPQFSDGFSVGVKVSEKSAAFFKKPCTFAK